MARFVLPVCKNFLILRSILQETLKQWWHVKPDTFLKLSKIKLVFNPGESRSGTRVTRLQMREVHIYSVLLGC